MTKSDARVRCDSRFAECFGRSPAVTASAPGRLEVLGNHTDYNGGLTLSCAVDLRCYACITLLSTPEVMLASTAYDAEPAAYPLDRLTAPEGCWANYVLGLARALQQRGEDVPGFALLIDSQVLGSAGLSSSSALEMSVLTALASLMRLELPPIELAQIGQHVESAVVGAKTGLLDPLSSLLGRRDHLLGIDFKTLQAQQHAMPAGWCFVAIDSGVKHDLTREYNDRRASCEQAAAAMGVPTLREVDLDLLTQHQGKLPEDAWRCARHVIGENVRVQQAHAALARGDVETLGQLMFMSHASSRDDFRNSCAELDELVAYAEQDERCVGARLSGGGFGGITIHLVRDADAQGYLDDALRTFTDSTDRLRWGAVCRIDDGARVEQLPNV